MPSTCGWQLCFLMRHLCLFFINKKKNLAHMDLCIFYQSNLQFHQVLGSLSAPTTWPSCCSGLFGPLNFLSGSNAHWRTKQSGVVVNSFPNKIICFNKLIPTFFHEVMFSFNLLCTFEARILAIFIFQKIKSLK